ncbi:MAG: DUF3179 domain-containing (seleno)protein, partial [Ahrensia sp.]
MPIGLEGSMTSFFVCALRIFLFFCVGFGVGRPTPLLAQETTLPAYVIEQFGTPPPIPDGPLSKEIEAAVQAVFIDAVQQSQWGADQAAALDKVAASGDPRLAWIIADRMRFTWQLDFNNALAAAAAKLLGIEFTDHERWHLINDHLIAWDVPAFPGYLAAKRAIFTHFVPGWEMLFVEGDIEWQMVSWGGVLIDDRPHDATEQVCNCIPATDNPETSSADAATWLKDDDVVFGISINGEHRAYPRRILEVREMVNDTLGGRDLALPYCSLCGAAQAYFTDRMPAGVERPILRTSGLLIRSNKIMYDLNTYSLFDTFRGNAVTGPLYEKAIKLEQASVVTTDWATWKKQYPETTVLVERLALGRDYDFRNGRDARGPIFPIGDVDPRLPVQEDVVGVVTGAGQAIAFQRSRAMAALQGGVRVGVDDVALVLEAGGLKAVDANGTDLS